MLAHMLFHDFDRRQTCSNWYKIDNKSHVHPWFPIIYWYYAILRSFLTVIIILAMWHYCHCISFFQFKKVQKMANDSNCICKSQSSFPVDALTRPRMSKVTLLLPATRTRHKQRNLYIDSHGKSLKRCLYELELN